MFIKAEIKEPMGFPMTGSLNLSIHLFGLVALGHMWALMAETAQEKLANGANGSTQFLENKLVTGKFFMERIIPEAATHLVRIQTGCETMMELDAEAF